MTRKKWDAVVAMGCALIVLATALPARAVDAPKWVAALYVDAQRSVGLRWMPVPGATGYKVLRSTTKGTGYAEIASPAVPQHFDTTVEPGTTYYYVLRSVAGSETSPDSDERSMTIPGQKKAELVAPVLEKPVMQASTQFGKTTFKVGLAWKAVPNVVAYNLFRSEVSGKDFALVGSVPEDRYTDATVEEGKTYYYVVTALDNQFQESKQSAEQSVKIEKPAETKKSEKAKEVKNEIVVKRTKQVLTIPIEDGQKGKSVANFAYHRDEDQAYVIDGANLKVVILDSEGTRVGEFGEQGMAPGQFLNPTGITVNPDGDLVVADVTRRRVMTFAPNGTFKREFALSDKKFDETKDTDKPAPNAAVQVGEEMFIVDQSNSHVYVYDLKGAFLRGFGRRGTQGDAGLGTLSLPADISADAKGNLMVRDYGGTRVAIFAPDGTPLAFIGEGVKGLVGAFVKVGRPIVYQPTGEIVVPDNAMGNIQFFDPNTYAYKYTLAGPEGKLKFNERADWGLASTNQIDYDTKGRIWVTMTDFQKLVVLELIDK